VRLLIVMIPQKRTVYAPVIHRHSELSADFKRCVRLAAEANTELVEFLTEHNIEVLDATASLQAIFDTGVTPYFESHDGHLNAIGNRVIADLMRPMFTDPSPANDTNP
jgi:hypothetical protein